jgi:hypothetical protein
MVLSLDGADGKDDAKTLIDQPALEPKPPELSTAAAAVEEGALIAGLPMGAVIAVGLVVAAVVAILVFGG